MKQLLSLQLLLVASAGMAARVHAYLHSRSTFKCSNHRINPSTATSQYLFNKGKDRSTASKLYFDVATATALESASVAGGLYLLLQLAVYWRMQFVAAGLVGGIPSKSTVVELDAVDGKNIFYLSKDCFYTAIMATTGDDASKQLEKQRINEQLILESIGKANSRGDVNLQGKIRSRTQDIPSRSTDCVVSVGALQRTISRDTQNPNNAKVDLINEAYRILRPGGLFVFLEPDNDRNTIDLVYKVFPRSIAPVASQSKGGDERRQAKTTARAVAAGSARDDLSLAISDKRGKRAAFKRSSETNDSPTSTLSVPAEATTPPLITVADDDEEGGPSLQPSDEGSPGGGNSRPGITFQEVSTLGLFPYVTGIAVKP